MARAHLSVRSPLMRRHVLRRPLRRRQRETRAQVPGLGQWRTAEQALEFAVELRSAGVADRMAGGLGAHALAHHQQTRLMQACALQVLHRRGLGDRLMAMTPLRGILNITSMGGYITMPGIAYYCGSKFALEGVSDALGKEVASLGIAVTAVAPGSFRTDWAGRAMVRSPRTIADYDALFDPLRQARQEKSDKQPGDPRKAARAMLQAIDAENPPAHLLLGSDALGLVRQKLKALEEEIAAWEEVTRSTDG